MNFKSEKKDVNNLIGYYEKSFFILFGYLFFKMILALKSRRLFDATEAKKICIYIIFVPKNKELPGIRSYHKKVKKKLLWLLSFLQFNFDLT